MNLALWKKAWRDAWRLLVGLAVLLFVFHWVYIWVSSPIDLKGVRDFLEFLPQTWEQAFGVSFDEIATPGGRIAMSFIDPVVLFAAISWGIARGSDVVAGELGRGTMELLLAQPVRRGEIVFTQAVVATLGAAVLACASWGGVLAGILNNSIPYGGESTPLSTLVRAADFLPGSVNLFGLMFFLAGLSTLVSSWENYRWRTIGVVAAAYMVSLLVKMVGRLAGAYDWLQYITFLGAFEPQKLVLMGDAAWPAAWRYTGVLVGLGLAAYAGAAVIFAKRDLPAPT